MDFRGSSVLSGLTTSRKLLHSLAIMAGILHKLLLLESTKVVEVPYKAVSVRE